MDISEIIPPSTRRVEQHTNQKVNETIRKKTIENVNEFKNSSYEALTERLKQLNREWDTELVLEANAAAIIFISTILGFFTTPYWFILVGIVSFFLLQHAVQGWCPPLPVIRRLGIRTPEEIYDEKLSIKFLRGDFSHLKGSPLEIIDIAKKD